MLREERRLRVLENRVLRGIFVPKRDSVTEEWRKLHNLDLSDLYPHPILYSYKMEKNEMGGTCSAYGGRGVYTFLVEKSKGNGQLGRPRHRWRIILRWVFRKWDVGIWTVLSWLMIGTVGGDL